VAQRAGLFKIYPCHGCFFENSMDFGMPPIELWII